MSVDSFPDVTPAAALFTIVRVAKARCLTEDRVRQVVEAQANGRLLGTIGEPNINVLRMDAMKG
jgi:K+-transporting ATPase ATPase C chain